MLSKGKLILTGGIINIASFITAVYLGPYFEDIIIRNFSIVRYIDDRIASNGILASYALYLAFSIVSLFWNVRTLKVTGRLTIRQLILQCTLDLIALPLSMLIMVLMNNRRIGMVNLTSVLNPLALGVVLLCKQIILLMLYRKKDVSR